MSPLLVRPAVIAVAATVVLLEGCGGSGSSPAGGPAPTSAPSTTGHSLEGLADGVCGVARQARAGDPAAARALFVGRVHEDLHQLADELSEMDRAVAARVLEAKQRVEDDLDRPVAPPDLGSDADELVAATGEGLRRLGLAVEECER